MGYTSIEAASYNDGKFYGNTPEEFKRDVEAVGMKVLSSHCGKGLSDEELASGDFSESMKWWDQCIAAHKAGGMEYIADPVPSRPQDAEGHADLLQLPQRDREEMPGKPGIKYGYHNHAHEFQKIEDKAVMLDYMIENTDPENLFIELDVYWAVMGEASPSITSTNTPAVSKCSISRIAAKSARAAMVGFDAIFENAKTAGVENIIVEVEQYSYDVEKSVKLSLDYLLKAPFVKASYSK